MTEKTVYSADKGKKQILIDNIDLSFIIRKGGKDVRVPWDRAEQVLIGAWFKETGKVINSAVLAKAYYDSVESYMEIKIREGKVKDPTKARKDLKNILNKYEPEFNKHIKESGRYLNGAFLSKKHMRQFIDDKGKVLWY